MELEYLDDYKDDDFVCPKCGGTLFADNEPRYANGNYIVLIRCHDCDFSFDEVYKLNSMHYTHEGKYYSEDLVNKLTPQDYNKIRIALHEVEFSLQQKIKKMKEIKYQRDASEVYERHLADIKLLIEKVREF